MYGTRWLVYCVDGMAWWEEDTSKWPKRTQLVSPAGQLTDVEKALYISDTTHPKGSQLPTQADPTSALAASLRDDQVMSPIRLSGHG